MRVSVRVACVLLYFCLSTLQVGAAPKSKVFIRDAPSFVAVGETIEVVIQVELTADDRLLVAGVVDDVSMLVSTHVDLMTNSYRTHRFGWTVHEPGDFHIVASIVTNRSTSSARAQRSLVVVN